MEALGPELVLVDVELLGDDPWTLLGQIKAAAPKVHCIALICNVQKQREALAAGADAVLFKGFPVNHLAEAIEPMTTGHERESK
jgi:DNA-binding NarL/FixJ family response regulator